MFYSVLFFIFIFLLRQVFAMGFIIMSYKYLVNRKVLKFVFFVLLASLFHSSALFFIVAYPVCRLIKFGLKNYLFILMTFLVASLNGNSIMQLITKYDPLRASYITNGIYETSGSAFLSSIIINVLLLVFAQFFEKRELMKIIHFMI
ncbi:EpsG family protein [Lactobacillus helveticus]|uniref:EpsG family protein n=1 Tax=Lactobacillus helveticus TaxID=1587 RepID=UPI0015676029